MVVVEGVGRSLDPKLDMWSTAEPVVREWITRNLGPVGRLEGAVQGAGELGHFLSGVPGFLTRAARVADQIDDATRDGVVLSQETVAALRRGAGAADAVADGGAVGDRGAVGRRHPAAVTGPEPTGLHCAPRFRQA